MRLRAGSQDDDDDDDDDDVEDMGKQTDVGACRHSRDHD